MWCDFDENFFGSIDWEFFFELMSLGLIFHFDDGGEHWSWGSPNFIWVLRDIPFFKDIFIKKIILKKGKKLLTWVVQLNN